MSQVESSAIGSTGLTAGESGDDNPNTEGLTDQVASEVSDELRERPWIASVARIGWIAKGIVYGAMGYGAIRIGVNASEPEADAEYTGIVSILVEGTISRFLLGVISIGLVFYVAFRLLTALLVDETSLDAWAHRIAYTFSAVTYTVVGWVAATSAIRGVHDDGTSVIQRVSISLLETTAGRIALGLGAAGALVIGCYFLYKGATRRFMREVRPDDLSRRQHDLIEWTGAVGWVGRALVVGSVSVFVLLASIRADPSDPEGLDSAMHRLAADTPGRLFVLVTGATLLVYAVYCVVSARHRRLGWSRKNDPDRDQTGERP